jgi:hypothetical protein
MALLGLKARQHWTHDVSTYSHEPSRLHLLSSLWSSMEWKQLSFLSGISGYYLIIIRSPEYPALEVFTSYFQMAAGTIVPFVIISASNVIIIVTIRHASKQRSKMEYGDNGKRNRDTVYMTRMLVFISLAYIILSLPYRWYTVGTKIPGIIELYNMHQVISRKQFILGVWSVSILWAFNYAINFFLYCIGGGSRYRRETLNILRGLLFCTFGGGS